MAAAEWGPVQQIEAGGLDVGYVDVGPPDGQAVVLLHGWPYDIHSYAEAGPALGAAGYRVVVPYLRGYDTYRTITGGVGHNLPQEAPAPFVDAVIEAGGLS